MEASALELRCSDRVIDEADNSVGGVTGHVKDDDSMAGSQLPEQCGTSPPEGVAGRAAILSVVRTLGRLIDLLANESVEKDQACQAYPRQQGRGDQRPGLRRCQERRDLVCQNYPTFIFNRHFICAELSFKTLSYFSATIS